MHVRQRQPLPFFQPTAASRPAVSAAPSAAGDRLRLSPRATTAADPLPRFETPDAYKSYVINLVAKAQVAEADLEAARAARDAGDGGDVEVSLAEERLNGLKLQLAFLRDQFEPPAEWSRSRLLGGHGFDKEAFWKEQVEAIPGQEVVVPKPAPATEPLPTDKAGLLAAGHAAGSKQQWERARQAYQKAADQSKTYDELMSLLAAMHPDVTLPRPYVASRALERADTDAEVVRLIPEANRFFTLTAQETFLVQALGKIEGKEALAQAGAIAGDIASLRVEKELDGPAVYWEAARRAYQRAADQCEGYDELLRLLAQMNPEVTSPRYYVLSAALAHADSPAEIDRLLAEAPRIYRSDDKQRFIEAAKSARASL